MTQRLIDSSPTWLKTSYVVLARSTKSLLKTSGLLKKLDAKAKQSREFHYWRSLLAIHDISDMIELDVPWWTYSAIDYLTKKLETFHSPITVFEWGSGASTLWLAKRAQKVISIEHDAKWHSLLQPFLKNYVHVHSVLKQPDNLLIDEKYCSRKMPGLNFKSYVSAIETYSEHYDVIIIDGRARNACLSICLPYLKPNGIILFDNSNRAEYQSALSQTGLTRQRFSGKVPCSPFPGETSILMRRA